MAGRKASAPPAGPHGRAGFPLIGQGS